MSDLVKIGVSLPIEGACRERCMELNERIVAIAPGPIRFGGPMTSEPHVTVAIGTVRETDLQLVGLVVADAAAEIAPFVAAFGPPERERVTGRYVTADVVVGSSVTAWRELLRERLMPMFVEPGRMTSESHLTLAVAETGYLELDRFIDVQPPLPECEVAHIDLAYSGKQGAKGSLIARWALGVAESQ